MAVDPEEVRALLPWLASAVAALLFAGYCLICGRGRACNEGYCGLLSLWRRLRGHQAEATDLARHLLDENPANEGILSLLCKQDPQRDLLKQYKLGKVLGHGTFGRVYRATRLDGSSDAVAVKVIAKDGASKMYQTWADELSMMLRLDHPYLVKLYEWFEDESRLSLILEMCEGEELFDRFVNGGCGEADSGKILRQLLQGVAYCHENGIVHRDLKPENILFASKDPGADIKIIDFGISIMMHEGENLTDAMGTLLYASPEILADASNRSYNEKCDLWSAGIIFYVLLTGRTAFGQDCAMDRLFLPAHFRERVQKGDYNKEPLRQVNVSPIAQDLLEKLLQPEPTKRISAAEALWHPFLSSHAESHTKSRDQLKFRTASQCFAHFQQTNKLERAVLTVIAHSSRDKEVAQLREIFKELDRNGKGKLEPAEVAEGLKRLGTPRPLDWLSIVHEADTDGDGMVSYTEFLAAGLGRAQLEQETHIKRAFEVFDLNHDGTITAQELETVIGPSAEELLPESGNIDFEAFERMVRDLAERR